MKTGGFVRVYESWQVSLDQIRKNFGYKKCLINLKRNLNNDSTIKNAMTMTKSSEKSGLTTNFLQLDYFFLPISYF